MCAVASRSLSSSIAAPSYPQNANRYIGSKMLSRLAPHSVWKLPKISHLIQVFIDSIVVLLLPQLRISSYDPLFGTRKCDFFTNVQPLYNRVTLEGKVVTCNLANGINSNGKSTHTYIVKKELHVWTLRILSRFKSAALQSVYVHLNSIFTSVVKKS